MVKDENMEDVESNMREHPNVSYMVDMVDKGDDSETVKKPGKKKVMKEGRWDPIEHHKFL